MKIPRKTLATAIALLVITPHAAFAAERIEEVIVTGSHLPLALSRSGSAVTVIGTDEIHHRAPLLVTELLRDVPGLAVSRNGVLGSSTQVRMRGAEGNHVLVLIDGVEANDPSQGDEFNWGTLTAEGIERIEVLRGPQSALLGSDAVAGVINIITRGAREPFSLEAQAEGGSFGTRQASLAAGHRSERAEFRIAAATLDSDGENISRSGGEEDGYRNDTLSLKAGFAASEALQVGASFRRMDGRSDFDGISWATGLPGDTDAASDFRGDVARLHAEHTLLDGALRQRIEYAYSGWDNRNREFGQSTGETRSDKDQYRYVGAFGWAEGTQQLALMLEREREDFRQRGQVQPWGDPNQDRSRDTDSAGLEWRGTFVDALTLAASARRDDNSEFDSSNTWRLEAIYAIESSGTRLRAAWGTAVKNPTFAERYGYYTNFQGNPDLTPEESESREIGIDQSWSDGRLSGSLTWFDADLEDEIDGFVFDPSTFNFTAANRDGRSRREGLEATLRAAITPSLSLAASYTYTDSESPDPAGGSMRELRRAPHIASLSLGWEPREDLQLNLNAQYNGSQDDQYFPPWPEPSQIVDMEDYTLLNLNATWRVTPAVELYARGENLLDEDYEEVFGYSTPGAAGYLGV
ncbi:MAG: TonB-dependent receptor plug domain-containing protein, partial [Gammaproteobacteria bacterium]